VVSPYAGVNASSGLHDDGGTLYSESGRVKNDHGIVGCQRGNAVGIRYNSLHASLALQIVCAIVAHLHESARWKPCRRAACWGQPVRQMAPSDGKPLSNCECDRTTTTGCTTSCHRRKWRGGERMGAGTEAERIVITSARIHWECQLVESAGDFDGVSPNRRIGFHHRGAQHAQTIISSSQTARGIARSHFRSPGFASGASTRLLTR